MFTRSAYSSPIIALLEMKIKDLLRLEFTIEGILKETPL